MTTLPTYVKSGQIVGDFLDSVVTELQNDKEGKQLFLYFYAVTRSGWHELMPAIRDWKRKKQGRQVVAYIGTDHAITEPDALEKMNKIVNLRMMVSYSGIFHPKVIWIKGDNLNRLWSGSNNLTGPGLKRNVEFSTLIHFENPPQNFKKWAKYIHSASKPVSRGLLNDYRKSFLEFQESRVSHIWRKRKEPAGIKSRLTLAQSFVMEIMPRETSDSGNQIQFPLEVAFELFGLPRKIGASQSVELENAVTGETRMLKMTHYRNSTTRLTIRELEFDDRPCVMLFKRKAKNRFLFEIVSEGVLPSRYRKLLKKCHGMTRQGGRHWAYLT